MALRRRSFGMPHTLVRPGTFLGTCGRPIASLPGVTTSLPSAAESSAFGRNPRSRSDGTYGYEAADRHVGDDVSVRRAGESGAGLRVPPAARGSGHRRGAVPVSYTHLTLPTKRIV